MYCEHCGKQIGGGEKFCSCCGKAVVETGVDTKRTNNEGVSTIKRHSKIASVIVMLVLIFMLLLVTLFSLSGSVISKKTRGEDSFGAVLGSKLSFWTLSLHQHAEDAGFIEELNEKIEKLEDYKTLSPGSIIDIEGLLWSYKDNINEDYFNQYVFVVAVLILLCVVNVVTILICGIAMIACVCHLVMGRIGSQGIGNCAIVTAGAILFEAYMSKAVIKIMNAYYFYNRTILTSGSYMSLKLFFAFLILGMALLWSVVKVVRNQSEMRQKELIATVCSAVLFVVAIFAVTKLSAEVLETEAHVQRVGLSVVDTDVEDLNVFDIPVLSFFSSCYTDKELEPSESVNSLILLILVFVAHLFSVGNFLQIVSSRKKYVLSAVVCASLSIILYTVFCIKADCTTMEGTFLVWGYNVVLIVGAVAMYILNKETRGRK